MNRRTGVRKASEKRSSLGESLCVEQHLLNRRLESGFGRISFA